VSILNQVSMFLYR